jgi:hypothetical protein
MPAGALAPSARDGMATDQSEIVRALEAGSIEGGFGPARLHLRSILR